jgi:hypothetical protein
MVLKPPEAQAIAVEPFLIFDIVFTILYLNSSTLK